MFFFRGFHVFVKKFLTPCPQSCQPAPNRHGHVVVEYEVWYHSIGLPTVGRLKLLVKGQVVGVPRSRTCTTMVFIVFSSDSWG